MISGFFNKFLAKIKTHCGFGCCFVVTFSTWNFAFFPRGLIFESLHVFFSITMLWFSTQSSIRFPFFKFRCLPISFGIVILRELPTCITLTSNFTGNLQSLLISMDKQYIKMLLEYSNSTRSYCLLILVFRILFKSDFLGFPNNKH